MKVLHEDISPESAGVTRFVIFGLWAMILATDPLHWLTVFPLQLFNPVSPLRQLPPSIYPWLLSPVSLGVIRWLGAFSALTVALGWSVRWWGLLACLLLTAHQSLIRGFGHVNHNELALLLTTYPWPLFAWADRWQMRFTTGWMGLRLCGAPAASTRKSEEAGAAAHLSPSHPTHAYPVVAATLLFCMTYLLIGVYRVTNSGVSVFTSNSIGYWIVNRTLTGQDSRFALGLLVQNHPVFGKLFNLGFPFITLLECLAPLCLVVTWFRRLFLALMPLVHAAIFLTMKIFFWENLFLFVLLLDLDRWFAPKMDPSRGSVVFFDGVCGLCNSFIDGLLRRDRAGVLLFAPLQGEAAKKAVGELPADTSQWSMAYLDRGKLYRKSDAVLRAVSRTGGVNRLFELLLLIPAPIRDFFYDLVAKKRYAIFGVKDACRMPTEAERARFLD